MCTTGNEFESRTFKELVTGGHFSSGTDDGNFDWPKVLEEMLDSSDPVRITVTDGYQLQSVHWEHVCGTFVSFVSIMSCYR